MFAAACRTLPSRAPSPVESVDFRLSLCAARAVDCRSLLHGKGKKRATVWRSRRPGRARSGRMTCRRAPQNFPPADPGVTPADLFAFDRDGYRYLPTCCATLVQNWFEELKARVPLH